MNIVVDRDAASWLKQEMQLQPGDELRLFVRLGGCSTVHSGFSLGIVKERPVRPGLQAESEGIVFYMEEDNVWYLEGKDLFVRRDSEEGIVFDLNEGRRI